MDSCRADLGVASASKASTKEKTTATTATAIGVPLIGHSGRDLAVC